MVTKKIIDYYQQIKKASKAGGNYDISKTFK